MKLTQIIVVHYMLKAINIEMEQQEAQKLPELSEGFVLMLLDISRHQLKIVHITLVQFL